MAVGHRHDAGYRVSIVVSVSTATAISLTPMLSAYILHKEGGIHDYKGIGIVYKPIDRALAWLDNAYARALRGVLAHRRWTLGTVGALFVASLFLLTQVPTEFFPPSDNGRIEAVVKLPQNVSVEYTARVARRIDSILYEKYPEVILVSASAGASSRVWQAGLAGSTSPPRISTIQKNREKYSSTDSRTKSCCDLSREQFLLKLPC